MCLDCSCQIPDDDHGDPRHIVMADLQAAADASGMTPEQAAANIVLTLANLSAPDSDDAAKSDTVALNVLKTSDERKFTLGVAYPALKADVNTAADGHRDYVSEAALERAAWSWMTKHRDVGLHHRDGTSGSATVVESYIWRGDPWVVKAADGTTVTVNPGDWVMGCVWSDDAWPLVKSGLIRGFSPQGGARRRQPSRDDLSKLRS